MSVRRPSMWVIGPHAMSDEHSLVSPSKSPRSAEVDLHLAYAEASVMLVECLMLVMIERNLLPLESLIEAVETAIEAKQGQVRDGSHPQIARIAGGVLSQIANSLRASERGSAEKQST
jgi:hypothetical protein